MSSGLLCSPIDGHEGQGSGHLCFVDAVGKDFRFSEGFNHAATWEPGNVRTVDFKKKGKQSWRLNYVILFDTVNKAKYQEIVMIRF